MKDKYFKYFIIASLLFIIGQGIFSTPKGASEEEVLYRMRIHDLNQEKVILQKKNNLLESKIKRFENEILKNDSVIGSYTNNQLDSAFSNYFSR